MEKKLITLAQAARLARCAYSTAWKWAQEGRLETVLNENGRVAGVTEESVQSMIAYFDAKRTLEMPPKAKG